MPTLEQYQRVMEWAGFKLSTNKHQFHWKWGVRQPHWIAPDGTVTRDNFERRGRLPRADMNTFEKWILRKLFRCDLHKEADGFYCECQSHESELWGKSCSRDSLNEAAWLAIYDLTEKEGEK